MNILMSHERKQVWDVLSVVKDRSMLTQAATLERELTWAARVYAELIPAKNGGHDIRFIILSNDGTWASIVASGKR